MKVISLIMIFSGVGATPLLANREKWVKEDRQEKCEKVVEARVIKIEKFADLGDHQEIAMATIAISKVIQDIEPDKKLGQTAKVYFLRPKPSITIRDGSNPFLKPEDNYTLYLTRIEDVGDLKSGLFVELKGDAIPLEEAKE